MTLQNILKRTLFLICALGALQFMEPLAQAMQEEKIEGEKDNSPKTPKKGIVNSHNSSGIMSEKKPAKLTIKTNRRKTVPGVLSKNSQEILNEKGDGINSFDSVPDNNKKKPTQQKKEEEVKCVQWVGNIDFKLHFYSKKDQNKIKFTYNEIIQKNHLELRKIVDLNKNRLLRDSENLFALQLTFLIQPGATEKKEPRLITYPLTITDDNRTKNVLFVSGADKVDKNDVVYMYNGCEFSEKKKQRKEWFEDQCNGNSSPPPLTHHHSEQWAMLAFYLDMDKYLSDFCDINKPSKIYGIFLDGHTWNDPCIDCQKMFKKKNTLLTDRAKDTLEKICKTSKKFFILPVLSSQIYYPKSKRWSPREILKSNDFSSSPGSLDQNTNKILQYTKQYKEIFTEKYPPREYNLKKNFVEATLFPCFWLYEDKEVTKEIKEEVFKLFQSAIGYGEKDFFLSLKFSYNTINKETKNSQEKIRKLSNFKILQELGQELRMATSLTFLQINDTNLREKGAKELAEALPYLTALTQLNLENNSFATIREDESILPVENPIHFQELLHSIANLKRLNNLNLSNNILNFNTTKVLTKTLAQLENLEVLTLQSSDIDYQSADRILTQAQLIPSLTSIDLIGNKIFAQCLNNISIQELATRLFKKGLRVKLENKTFKTESIVKLDY